MMIRASEPPMRLRLCVESVILSLCSFTDLSDLRGFRCACDLDQQKLLIRHVGGMSTINVDKMTPAQCRAARGLLGITQSQLAHAAGRGLSTVVDFEKERRLVSLGAVEAIRAALERAGIEFIAENGGGEGLRLRKPRHPKRK
jgi:DNA-binding XRE family transcriptional regulator